jgi:hypothetical protein
VAVVLLHHSVRDQAAELLPVAVRRLERLSGILERSALSSTGRRKAGRSAGLTSGAVSM